MIKPFVTVELTLPQGNDTPWRIYDYVDEETGEYVSVGTQADAMLDRHEDIHYMEHDVEGDFEIFIPYHAIMKAKVTKAPAEYEKPEDSYCQPVESPFTPVGGGRKITFPKYGADNPTIESNDGLFLFNIMFPYFLEQGIELKFMGGKVTDVSYETDPDTDAKIYTLVTEDGTHTLVSNTDHDGTYFYPTVDGETVSSITFDVDTKKYYFFASDTDDAPIESIVGLYDAGSQPVCPYSYPNYRRIAFGGEEESHAFGEDRKFPAITADVWYYAHM